MKKLLNNATCLLISICCVFMFACGGGVANDANTVQFYYWNSGYGTEWLEQIVNDFNNKQSEYKVVFEYHDNMNTVVATLDAGPNNTYDLYMTGLSSWSSELPNMVDLSDVLDSTYEGESKTIRQKFDADLLTSHTASDGTVGSLIYGNSATGIFYNQKIFNDYGYNVPRTTNELENLMFDMAGDARMKSKEIYPMIHFADGNNGYWKFVYEPWVVQYMGVEEYKTNFLQLKNSDGQTNSRSVLEGKLVDGTDNKKNDARYKVLNALEAMITNTTVHPSSNSNDVYKSERAFVLGQAAMMISGSWIRAEGSISQDSEIRIMKTPVLSAIVEKLDNNEMSDSQLSSVIQAVDEGKDFTQTKEATDLTDLTENDYLIIKEARGIVYDNNVANHVFIPKYSNAIDGAKEFLKYFYSDEATLVWMNSQHELAPVILDDETKLSTSQWSGLDLDLLDKAKNSTYKLTDSLTKCDILRKNSIDMFTNISIITALSSDPAGNIYKNSNQLWQQMLTKINTNWSMWSM